MRLLKSFLLCSLLFASFNAHAEEYLVMNYSDNVRIVLSNVPCPKGMKGKRAAAQRIDKQYVRGCWIQDPTNKDLVRVDWEMGDFTSLPVSAFYPVKTLDEKTKPQL